MLTPLQEYVIANGYEKIGEELGISAFEHPTLPLVGFKYSQVDSPKTHPVVRASRGTVLEKGTWKLVAHPFKRFFNYGENLEELATFDWSSVLTTTKEDGCFLHETVLNLWGGGTITIGEVVNKKLKPILVGKDENGNIVPCEVTNWFNNGTKNNWMEITTNGRTAISSGSGGHPNKLRVTTNHSIFINGKFQPALEAKVGDILISHEFKPNQSVLHMIESSLLGDGSLIKNGNGYKFVDGHTAKHKEFTKEIENWLGECSIKTRERLSGFGSEMLDVTSSSYEFLNKMRNKWYPNGKKKIPDNLDWMDNFSVAKWYMDDGCLSHDDLQEDRAIFSTHGFEKIEVDRLCEKLNQMYGVLAVPSLNKEKWAIRINAGRDRSIEEFWMSIASFIVPCMRYKLPERYRSVDYVEYPKGKEEGYSIECNVINIKMMNPLKDGNNKNLFPSGRCGFDIETTTHNYFAKNLLVHNSLAIVYNYNSEWHMNTSGSFGLGKYSAWSTDTWRDLFWKTAEKNGLQKDKLNPELTYIFELCTLENKVVRMYPTSSIFMLSCFKAHEEMAWEFSVEESKRIGSPLTASHTFKSIEEVEIYLAEMEKKDASYEGVVVRDKNNVRFKIKSQAYLALHHFSDNNNFSRVDKMVLLALKNEGDEILTYFPEVKDQYFAVKEKLQKAYAELLDVWRKNCHEKDQKTFALSIKGNDFSSLLFQLKKKNLNSSEAEKELDKIWREHGDLIVKKMFPKP